MRASNIFFATFAPLLVLACGGSSTPDVGSGNGSNGNQKSATSNGTSSSNGGGSSSSSGGSSSSGAGGGSGSASGSGSGSASIKRVFVTSVLFSGNLGGLTGADAECQSTADAQFLGGTWKAWISSGSVNAIDRINDVGPWYLVDAKTKVFNNKANLLTEPLSAINEDESGHTPSWTGLDGMWSGTTDRGVASGEDCVGWTSNLVSDSATTGSMSTDQYWGGSPNGPIDCDAQEALICFEQ